MYKRQISCIRQLAEGVVLIDFANQFFQFSGSLLSLSLIHIFSQLLRPVYGQAIVCPVPWFKADDIVVAFHIFPPLVLPIAEICPHTGNGKILAAAVQRGQPVVLAGDKPAGFIKDGLHGKLVMLKQLSLIHI